MISENQIESSLVKLEDFGEGKIIVMPSAVKLQNSITRSSKKELRDPTETELCKCIWMIRQSFPQCKLDRIISYLHSNLVEDDRRNKLFSKEKEKQYLFDDDDFYSEDSLSEFEKKKMQQQYAKKFEDNEADPRFYEEREIAKLFCLKGYGYPTARQYLGDNVYIFPYYRTPNRYNNVITTIVRLSYRKLQYYIIKHMQPTLPMISKEELKMIKTPLVNCRNWMSERQSENFHRFVKLTYKIKTVEPERQVVLELHQAIMQQLRERNVTYKPHRRGGDPNNWSPEMDIHLISNYLNHPTPCQLQKQLILLYPSHRNCFELPRLRLRLERLLRFSLKKIYSDRDKFGLNEPQTLSDYFVSKISRSVKAIDVRKRLLSYYLDSDTNAMKLRWVREVIEQFVKASRDDVEEIEDSSCQLLAKQQLKTESVPASAVKEKQESENEEFISQMLSNQSDSHKEQKKEKYGGELRNTVE